MQEFADQNNLEFIGGIGSSQGKFKMINNMTGLTYTINMTGDKKMNVVRDLPYWGYFSFFCFVSISLSSSSAPS